jgi:hypothetical protein
MKADPLDTDATMAGCQRSRCDAQETWMPHQQLAAQPAATGRLPRAPRAVFRRLPADSAEAACESLHKALLRKRGGVHALGGTQKAASQGQLRMALGRRGCCPPARADVLTMGLCKAMPSTSTAISRRCPRDGARS